jgi:hypothetical protein
MSEVVLALLLVNASSSPSGRRVVTLATVQQAFNNERPRHTDVIGHGMDGSGWIANVSRCLLKARNLRTPEIPVASPAQQTNQDVLSALARTRFAQQPSRPLPNRPHLATEVAMSGLTDTVIESPTFSDAMAASLVGLVVLIV